ncbi:hypothetical protein, partial [Flavobacterium hydatis]
NKILFCIKILTKIASKKIKKRKNKTSFLSIFRSKMSFQRVFESFAGKKNQLKTDYITLIMLKK